MDFQTAENLAKELLCQHHLDEKGWRFAFDRAKKRAGSCRYGQRLITVARDYTKAVDEEEFRNTVLHEIAHALAGPEHGHDEVWKRTALSIGCDAQRCHVITFTEPPYLLTCENDCFQVKRHRVKSSFLQKRICAICHGSLKIRANPEFSQRDTA
jgi:predicted SprT family Zn-dependent metalloprotease